ncbi:uncharacterized protein KQ657_001495 [Scheffersomyces spartinae]|uniref:Uncharacterized protein n=1 Tax=Scheffersomyces spartinae TaxID=45513 RepID=A0A9P7V7L4_9ASCO|nr:uncharacterized protein KQ657_001495 [Scheffersomyces spartinae]KAG7192712.1 hypothetical protein KQ657_001495 [Scheffersomyces spartinae]
MKALPGEKAVGSVLSIDEVGNGLDSSSSNEEHNVGLEKNSNFLSLLGFSFGLIYSWLGVATQLGIVISSGGAPIMVWGLVTTCILASYLFTHPDFIIEKWHTFLVYELLNIFITLFNFYSKTLPYVTKTAFYLSILTFLVTMIISGACALGRFQSPSFVFKTFDNVMGWSTTGMSFVANMVAPIWLFAGIDAASHQG